jgi:hypothetical protein
LHFSPFYCYFLSLSSKSYPQTPCFQPPIQWVPGVLSLGVKRPAREADHSLHLVPMSRMSGAIPPLPQCAFMAWCSVKKSTGTTLLPTLSTLFSVTVSLCSSSKVCILILGFYIKDGKKYSELNVSNYFANLL